MRRFTLPKPFVSLLFATSLAIGLSATTASRADIVTTSMALGGDHTCAITPTGGVKCWGENAQGQLGDGTTYTRWIPVPVTGLASGIAALTASGRHTCALTTMGGAKCWGANSSGDAGSLGDDTAIDQHTPVDVVGLGSGVLALSAGGGSTCALMFGGGVKCWGRNSVGSVGDGTTTVRKTPVDVLGLAEPATALAVGGLHACVILQSGGVRCWGYNGSGQLGNNSLVDSPTPVEVVGLGGTPIAIAAGGSHTCVIMAAGNVKCWGGNRYGQLGEGTQNTDFSTWKRLTPVDVLGLPGGATALVAGENHTCVRTPAGGAKCWGTNQFYYVLGNDGNLGSGANEPPSDVFGLTSGVSRIFTGPFHMCALTSGGVPRCWGDNEYGQLGSGAARGAVRVPHSGIPDYQIAAGISHNLVVTPYGEVWGWGDNTAGKLGNGSTAASAVPVRAAGLTNIVAVAAGMDHSLALRADGTVWAWGLNEDGQLGIGAASPTSCKIPSVGFVGCATTPVHVASVENAIAVAAGWRHSLALLADATVWEWGNFNQGLLAPAPDAGTATPTQKAGLFPIRRISAGYMHTVVLDWNDRVLAWGRGAFGELGPSRTAPTLTPTQVGFATDISAGGGYTLALNDGYLDAWGINTYGNLGDPNVPTDGGSGFPGFRASRDGVPGMTDVMAFSAGFGFGFVRRFDGTVWSWGLNHRGQIGSADPPPDFCGIFNNYLCRRAPANVATHDFALALGAGGAHTFTTRPGGAFVLFGDNSVAQLANTGTNFGSAFSQLVYDPDFTLTPGGVYGSGSSVGISSTPDGITLESVDAGLMFGGQVPNSTSAAKTLVLRNLSDIAMLVQSVVPTGDFNRTNYCPIPPDSLAPGSHCFIDVRFGPPTGTGERVGLLTIGTNFPDAPSVSVALNGVGLGVPGAPQSVGATAGNAQAAVYFSAPASDGGAQIAFYTATSNPGGLTSSGSGSPLPFTGLANGTSYTFTVTATNGYGASAPSSPSNAVTPIAPATLTVARVGSGTGAVSGIGINCPGDCSETFASASGTVVTLTATASGGSTFAGWSGGGCSGTGNCVITMSSFAAVTATFTITGTTIPGAPTIAAATPGNGTAIVSFTPPASNGGLPITAYSVSCTPGPTGASGLASPLTVTGLANGQLQSCSVRATNANGVGPPSTSLGVTPSASAPLALAAVQSRKLHSGVGNFDLQVDHTQPIGGSVTVEPRAIGSGHQVVFQFNAPVTFGVATSVDAAAAPAGTPNVSFSGNNATVTVTAIPDNKRVTVSLTNLNGAGGSASASIAFLVGDVNGSRAVTSSDILAAKGRSGTVNSATFRYDVDISGSVTASDIVAVKDRAGLASQ